MIRFNGELPLGYFTAFDNMLIPKGGDRDLALQNNIEIARELGYDCLEVAAAISDDTLRDPTVDTLNLVDIVLDDQRVAKIKGWLTGGEGQEHISISSLGYYDNIMDGDQQIRDRNIDHLKKVIDAAQKLGVEYVGTFAGRDMTKTVPENLALFEEIFPDIIQYAKDQGVKLMFENCPMEGWTSDERQVQSISHSPAMWNKMFDIVKEKGLDGYLGLNLDPSHLTWQDIDPIQAVYDLRKAGHADKIFHVHAKDILRDNELLQQHGIYGDLMSEVPWCQAYDHKVPGTVPYAADEDGTGSGIPDPIELRNSVYWRGFISALRDVGYSGAISFEHEDHDFKGDPNTNLVEANALRKEALGIAHDYLTKVVVDTAERIHTVDQRTGGVTVGRPS